MSSTNCGSLTDTGQHILCFLHSPFSAQIQANSIGVAAGYALGVTAFTVIFFSLIRPRHHLVYEPRAKYADKKHAPPAIGKNPLAWIKPTASFTEAQVVERVGLDAAMFLRFLRMLRNMFAILSILGCAILIPVHVTQTNLAITDPSTTSGATPLNQQPNTIGSYILSMTPQLVPPPVMWAHVVMAYVFNIIVVSFLWWNYKAVARMRKEYFQSTEYQHSLHSRSLWMMDIPQQLRSDQGILQIVDSIEHTAGLPRAAIARNVRDLPELIEEHSETVKKLESVLAKYLKNPAKLPAQRPTTTPSKRDHRRNRSGRVDAIDYLAKRIKELEIEIRDTRESIDKRNAMAYGFATYDRIEEAHTVAYAARKKKPKGTSVNLAPRPNDFIWKNMSLSKKTRARKRFIANLWVALLTVVWIVPNAFIAIFLVNLNNLGAIWPAFQTSLEDPANKSLYAVVQAILGPTLLSSFYLCLPIIFRRLSIRAGDLTKSSRERHVTHKLYAFFVFNNLVVFSVFGVLWTFIATVISTTGNSENGTRQNVWEAIQNALFFRSLLASLCTVSIFWITWLLQRNLTVAIDLSQIVQLFWVWFAKTFMSPTPRQKITWTAPPPFDYAQYFNLFLFYATVALCNSMLQPIVLICALVIFVIESFLRKYLLMYIFITKTESGGQYWNVLNNRMLFGLAVSHIVGALVIKGVQGADAWTTYYQLICMAPLFFIILGFKIYCLRNFEPQCKYYTRAIPTSAEAQVEGNKKRKNDRIGVKFGHPALYKPLIQPMVHANAQHLLPTLFHDSDGFAAQPDAYGETIGMDPMSEHEPGTKARNASQSGAMDMFEVVSESNMDFSYFKNRADFGDEHGGGGELYGRAQDLVSERSGTPASFLTQDSDDARSAMGTPPPPMPTNFAAFRNAGPHDNSPLGRGALYQHGNESQSRLLANAGGYSGFTPATPTAREHTQQEYPFPQQQYPPQEHTAPGTYGLNHWRNGSNGYVGLNTQADDEIAYDSYRTHHRAGSGPYTSGPQTPSSQYHPYNNGYGAHGGRF